MKEAEACDNGEAEHPDPGFPNGHHCQTRRDPAPRPRTANCEMGQKEKLTVVWNAYISGLLGGSGSLNVNRTTTAINQAFTQSPYLKK